MAQVTVSEAARLLKTSPSTVRRIVRDGVLRALPGPDRPTRLLLAEVLALARGGPGAPPATDRHVCLFVRGPQQLWPALYELIARPLAAGALVVVTHGRAAPSFVGSMVDPRLHTAYAEGRLRLLDPDAFYPSGGRIDHRSLIERLSALRATIHDARRPLVLVGEMSWAASEQLNAELISYEHALNRWLAGQPDCSLIFAYDSSRFAGEVALAVMEAHASTCLDGVCRKGVGEPHKPRM